MSGTIVLRTRRILLREFTAADVEAMLRLYREPAAVRQLGARVNRRESLTNRLRMVMTQYRQGPLGAWAAMSRADGAFLGWFELRPDADRAAQAELSYRLHQAVWGRGLATEGAAALLRKGFAECGLERIRSRTTRDDPAAQRVMVKIGMQCRPFHDGGDAASGASRQVGAADSAVDDPDEVGYALTRAEWERFVDGEASGTGA